MIGDKKNLLALKLARLFTKKPLLQKTAPRLLDNQFHLATAVAARQLKTPMLQYWVQALLALND